MAINTNASIILSPKTGSSFSIPICAQDLAVAFYKDLNSIQNNEVNEEIGIRFDTVYYGQYLSSGTINFYRTTGTFDYIDPSDGSQITGVSMPGTGLWAVPVNGVAEIEIDDGSYYPVCERAGDVLHDVSGNAIHISVSTPVWDETLYGSDYLNQCGYINKALSDFMAYNWETYVDGSPVTLDNNCLVPLAN
jgi:hypothetical protein